MYMTAPQAYAFPNRPRSDYYLMRSIASLLLATSLLLSGCIPQRTITPNPKEPSEAYQPAVPSNRVISLLDQAESAFARKRLTTPLDDNAYFRYLQVLSIDPSNNAAQAGIQRIVDTYLAWSIEAIDAQQYKKATNMLNKARSLDEQHPTITALESRISRAQNSRNEAFRLDKTALNSRTDTLVGQLHEIGRKAEQHRAKVHIVAQNDADGRWIYQQLNNASLTRIRATIEIGNPPTVQLTYP